jgi:cell division protein ZapA
MSNVTLSIGGREYAVACAEGEEAHVTGLGQLIDAKLATMGGAAGQAETRSLLFAALLLADELHEARTQLQDLRAQRDSALSSDTELAGWLEQFAGRVENLATRLEGEPRSA